MTILQLMRNWRIIFSINENYFKGKKLVNKSWPSHDMFSKGQDLFVVSVKFICIITTSVADNHLNIYLHVNQ